MNKTTTFVSLFKHPDGWRASFDVGGTPVGASHLPAFDRDLFAKTVSAKGVKYLRSKRPVVIEYSDIREGSVKGRFFTNIASISAVPEMDGALLDALLDDEPAKPVTTAVVPVTDAF